MVWYGEGARNGNSNGNGEDEDEDDIDQGEEWAKFRQAVQQDMMRPSSALYYIRWTFHLYKRMVIALEALNIMMQGDCTIDIRWIFHCVQLNP